MTGENMYEVVLLALCTWRESQNQRKVAQTGVAWSIKNRVSKPGWWGQDYVSVILHPYQYSSFNHNDPNATKMPSASDPAWVQCMEVAQDVYQGLVADPTDGSTHYFDASLDEHPPSWATEGTMVHVIDLDQLRFWKPIGQQGEQMVTA